MNQQYIGEHLFPGQLGQFLIILGFVSALFSAFSYFNSVRHEGKIGNNTFVWKSMGRVGFIIHAAAITGAFVTLFYIIGAHLFEYAYAYNHSSRGLKTKYLFSCFWEGSEGSFMLWAIWQALLGLIVVFKKDVLESRVMVIIALVQALLTTMLLGFYFGADIKVGSSPFMLLRNEMVAPIFSQPDYLKFIEDGRGLNVLLQNYWMVIHPPVLFLGFSLTLFPFAYSLAAIWKNDYKSFIKPTIHWALAGGCILGLGIMLGGAWAYESLNFGGYWAWDPVENASLVPWLILVAALHTLVIFKSTARSLKITLIFFILSFLFVWYSTFLTRTGVLGETSVHAFTGAANFLYWHLLIVIGIFVAISLFPIIKNWKKMPVIAGEEEASSREFWMLIGSFFLMASGIIIILYTSLPVWAPLYNKFSGTDIAPPEDPVKMYNNITIWFGIIIALLSGVAQFLKYKKTSATVAFKQLGLLAVIAIVLTVALVIGQNIKPVPLWIFTFTVFFTIIANLHYFIFNQKRKLKKAGASISHFGFGLMLLGIILSGYGKRVISIDNSGRVTDYGKATFDENAKESRENMIVFRNTLVAMGDYSVSYLGDSVVKNDPPITYYNVKFERRDPNTNEVKESFMMRPDVFVNPKGMEGINPNPDYKHYLTHDLFIYISSISKPGEAKDSVATKTHSAKVGDTIFVSSGYLRFDSLTRNFTNKNYVAKPGDIAAAAALSAYTIDGKVASTNAVFVVKGNEFSAITDTIRELGVQLNVAHVNPTDGTIEFNIRQRTQQDDFVVLKVMEFPYIMVLWLGVLVMSIGFGISWVSRKDMKTA